MLPQGGDGGFGERAKHSFANVLNHHSPIVIQDEVYKVWTKPSLETLRRIHPFRILESTGTPKAEAGSNALNHRAQASALKGEDTVKLGRSASLRERGHRAVVRKDR